MDPAAPGRFNNFLFQFIIFKRSYYKNYSRYLSSVMTKTFLGAYPKIFKKNFEMKNLKIKSAESNKQTQGHTEWHWISLI